MRFIGCCALAWAVIWSGVALGADLRNSKAVTYKDETLGSMPYRLFLPDGYGAGAKFPVILFLHGAGERGSDNERQVDFYIDDLIKETQHGAHKAILIAPQCPEGKQWSSETAGDHWNLGSYTNAQQKAISEQMQMAMNILAEVESTHSVDGRRVYITGISMGGYGTFDAVARFPGRFAAAMPLSGGGNTDAAKTMAHMGIWAYHGGKDGVVPVSGTGDVINAIKAVNGGHLNDGGDLVWSCIPEQGHAGWGEFYRPQHWRTDGVVGAKGGKGKDVYDWLFSHQLAAPKRAAATTTTAPTR